MEELGEAAEADDERKIKYLCPDSIRVSLEISFFDHLKQHLRQNMLPSVHVFERVALLLQQPKLVHDRALQFHSH